MSGVTGYHFIEKECGSKLHVSSSLWPDCNGAGSVFYLNGYHDDFTSPMKQAVREHCERRQINFVSLEYTGHGQSSGSKDVGLMPFLDDARLVFQKYCEPQNQPVTFVGHSIGGWFSIILAMEMEAKKSQSVAGVMSINPTFSLTGPNGFVTRLLSRPVNAAKFEANGHIISPLGARGADHMIYTEQFVADARKLDLVYNADGELLDPLLPQNFGITCMYGANDAAAPAADFEFFAYRLPEGAIGLIRREAEPDPANPGKLLAANHPLNRLSDLALINDAVDYYVARGKCMLSGKVLPQPAFAG